MTHFTPFPIIRFGILRVVYGLGMFVATPSRFYGRLAMICVDGFRYAVGRTAADVRTLRPRLDGLSDTQQPPDDSHPGSPEWQDSLLGAAQDYLARLEADPAADEWAIVAARHEVMLRRRALAEEIARDS
jgi:hypothetical protein